VAARRREMVDGEPGVDGVPRLALPDARQHTQMPTVLLIATIT
jgi:hypothetical protein